MNSPITTLNDPLGPTVLGYPRIGPRRELKRALESYWSGATDAEHLATVARTERSATWQHLRAAGLSSVPSNTFSLYDQMLDAAVLVGAVPERFRALHAVDPLAGYFAMARGSEELTPLEMTKWFDTNYHYLVPEISPSTPFELFAAKPLGELAEASALGVATRPVLIGPVTFLLMSKAEDGSPEGFQPLDRLDDLLPLYVGLLSRLRAAGATWVQLDEPALVLDRSDDELAAARRAYELLASSPDRPQLFVASYFGRLEGALEALVPTGIEAIGVDLVAGGAVDDLLTVPGLANLTVVAGVVDGRNVWRTDLRRALDQLSPLLDVAGDVAVSTSCSLLHVPYGLDAEGELPGGVRSWLAFAAEKVAEVVVLDRGMRSGPGAVASALRASDVIRTTRAAPASSSAGAVRDRLAAFDAQPSRRGAFAARRARQSERLKLPLLPTTTIGSFPQTAAVRGARAGHLRGRLDDATYTAVMRSHIERTVRLQEELGLDVLVHGEPERNDMVQYFAEQLEGFVTTTAGWVQSYGSRCVRPPIVHGDVSRTRPITVEWATYAQSLTQRPVKGMLTGPVTMLAWSFVRDDQPLAETARQVALAVRDEVCDLEAAGLRIVQVDEPALRELLPLRHTDRATYLEWAVEAFRLTTSGVSDATQIHTHLCYSEFGDVVDAIDALDADVTSIEAARSRMEVLPQLTASGMARGVGPGVYDIHSPRVPSVDEIQTLLRSALRSVPRDRLWVNPDCGLKTRSEEQVVDALRHLVLAAVAVRREVSTG